MKFTSCKKRPIAAGVKFTSCKKRPIAAGVEFTSCKKRPIVAGVKFTIPIGDVWVKNGGSLKLTHSDKTILEKGFKVELGGKLSVNKQ